MVTAERSRVPVKGPGPGPGRGCNCLLAAGKYLYGDLPCLFVNVGLGIMPPSC